ncbi:MAG: hypothetical protein FD137_1917 [Spirochaetes bacterium]|nr:MAG: hypothetical protein FD137_1917 [Spirochaetota bacterium]
MKKNTTLILLSYLTLYIVWGSTYLAIRVAVGTMPAFYVVGLRYFIAGAGFLLFSAASGRWKRLPSAKEFRAAAVLGFLLLILGNGLVTMGEKTVDSYIAAIIISATPFCVAFFNRLIYKEKLHRRGNPAHRWNQPHHGGIPRLEFRHFIRPQPACSPGQRGEHRNRDEPGRHLRPGGVGAVLRTPKPRLGWSQS